MIEEGEIIQALERILADQSVFISRLQAMEPGCKTPQEVKQIEKDIHEATDLARSREDKFYLLFLPPSCPAGPGGAG